MTKRTFITLLLIILLPLVVYAQIADELKLKCDKDKILSSALAKQRVIDSKTGNITEQDIISYKYITDEIVPVQERDKLKEDITRRTPNSLHFQIDNDSWLSEFYGDGVFYALDNDTWVSVNWATTTPEAYKEQTKKTLTDRFNKLGWVYADGATITSGNGDGEIQNYDPIWDTCRTALTGSASDTVATEARSLTGWFLVTYVFYRTFLPFDTSALNDSINVTWSQMRVRMTSATSGTACLVQTTQASNTNLINADYDQVGAVEGSPRIKGGAGYKYFILDATGYSWINPTGYTKLGLRSAADLDNTPDILEHSIAVATVENLTTLYRPVLQIQYDLVTTTTTTIAATRRMFLVE